MEWFEISLAISMESFPLTKQQNIFVPPKSRLWWECGPKSRSKVTQKHPRCGSVRYPCALPREDGAIHPLRDRGAPRAWGWRLRVPPCCVYRPCFELFLGKEIQTTINHYRKQPNNQQHMSDNGKRWRIYFVCCFRGLHTALMPVVLAAVDVLHFPRNSELVGFLLEFFLRRVLYRAYARIGILNRTATKFWIGVNKIFCKSDFPRKVIEFIQN